MALLLVQLPLLIDKVIAYDPTSNRSTILGVFHLEIAIKFIQKKSGKLDFQDASHEICAPYLMCLSGSN